MNVKMGLKFLQPLLRPSSKIWRKLFLVDFCLLVPFQILTVFIAKQAFKIHSPILGKHLFWGLKEEKISLPVLS